MGIKSILERNPIIPAIKDNTTLQKALNSNSELVFIILSNIINIKEFTDKLKKANKKVYILLFIHIICLIAKIMILF